MAKRTTSAVWVKGMADMLAAEGLDVGALFAAAGIERASLEGAGRAGLQTERISHLWELAVERFAQSRARRSRNITWRARPASTWSATP